MPRPIEEPFSLTNLSSGITEADGTASAWSDIWSYQVPVGVGHILLAEHTFSAYLEDSTNAQVGNGTCQVRLEVRDASQQDNKVIFGPILYNSVKEFQDANKIQRLNTVKPVPVTERMYIVVQVKDDAAIDASDSYFELATNRVRQTLT